MGTATVASVAGVPEAEDLISPQSVGTSFTRFFTDLYGALAAYAWSLTRDAAAADDLAQEALTRVYARWGLLSDPKPYAYRVVTNLVRDRWRSTLRDEARLAELAPRNEAVPEPDASVLDAVRRLPTQHRDVVLLHYYGDLSVQEVADVVRRPAGTVKRRLHEARLLLATALKEDT